MAVSTFPSRNIAVGQPIVSTVNMATAVKAPQKFLEPFVDDGKDGTAIGGLLRVAGKIQEASGAESWETSSSTLPVPPEISIGGHRGMGMNKKSPGSRRYSGLHRENTLLSFREAAASGASFVEFDVQVSRDGVPVIWHDNFAVTQNAAGERRRRRIAEIDRDEFKRLKSQTLLRGSTGTAELLEWKCTAEHELATLNELFQGMPESVGFDIEVKMTTPSSSPCTAPEEVDRVVDAILAEVLAWEVYTYRRMIFSSFDPDVALALRQRQNRIPVFLLSDGQMHYTDPRRCGLSTAVAFASSSKLDGVVLESSELWKIPGLVAEARRLGLYVLSYGVTNDDSARIRKQQEWGVHAAIVDDVRGVVQGLANNSSTQELKCC